MHQMVFSIFIHTYTYVFIVNFSADSYKTGISAKAVVVHVMAFGSFNSPFTVKVIPEGTQKGTYICVKPIIMINYLIL